MAAQKGREEIRDARNANSRRSEEGRMKQNRKSLLKKKLARRNTQMARNALKRLGLLSKEIQSTRQIQAERSRGNPNPGSGGPTGSKTRAKPRVTGIAKANSKRQEKCDYWERRKQDILKRIETARKQGNWEAKKTAEKKKKEDLEKAKEKISRSKEILEEYEKQDKSRNSQHRMSKL